MSTLQAPLGTPFSAASTASEVLDGLGLRGQEVIVTGGHGRLGREVSRALAAAGAAVTVAARDPQRAAAAVAGIAGLRVERLFATGYDPGAAYSQSKRANVLFTVELDHRYADQGVRAFAAHPGVIVGPGPFPPDEVALYQAQGLVDGSGAAIINPEAGKKTIEQGAATIVFGAASPLLDGLGGVYLKDSDIAALDDTSRPVRADDIPSDANSAMLDPHDARRLWELSEQLLG